MRGFQANSAPRQPDRDAARRTLFDAAVDGSNSYEIGALSLVLVTESVSEEDRRRGHRGRSRSQ